MRIPNNWTIGKVIGRALREQRLAQGLTQVELAERIGMSPTQMTRHEHGAVLLSIPALLRYAHGLGIHPSRLLDLDYSDPQPVGHSPHTPGESQ